MCDNANKILLVLTGGTICSFADEQGEKNTDTKRAQVLIKKNFEESSSKYKSVEFDDKIPLDTLSENMTLDKWNILVKAIRDYDINSYRGVIILHGTDTLAYTSSMLSLVLSGSSVPVMLVSSQLPLTDEAANGNDNFKMAVHLIMEGIEPNVYVPYKNMDGTMYVHFGAHLKQCPNLSNDFESIDAYAVRDMDNPQYKGIAFEGKDDIIRRIGEFVPTVMKLLPYVGLDYSRIDLRGLDAVVHGTYHSQTVCTDDFGDAMYSALSLIDANIPVFLEPSDYSPHKGISCYCTTAEAVKKGAIALWGMTEEMIYVKALTGVALGYKGNELRDFVAKQHINYEFHF